VPQFVPHEVLGAFDELHFAPIPGTESKYFDSVARGYDRMRHQRIVIAGLARDVEGILPRTIERIERQGRFFRDYRVVIYENDSVDTTRWILKTWAARNARVTVVCENRDDPVNQAARCLSRAARMAYYRSRCHELIRDEYSRYDHVMLVDTDLTGGWSYDGVAHTFGQTQWDFVGANGIIYRRRRLRPNAVSHYDAWAFRVDSDFTPLTTREVNEMLYHRGQQLKPVYSCFGGVGIYSMPAFLAGRYDGSDIEHVGFHREMHRQGYSRTFLNPNLIAVYGRKHRSWDRYAAAWIRMLDLIAMRDPTLWYFAKGSSNTMPFRSVPNTGTTRRPMRRVA
jgi:glycosyltransferase involved in cell wall biosynthesis